MAVEGRHVVAVHGGAWDIPEPLWEASLTGVKLAALRAFEVMDAGGSAVDAVEAAVVLMEEDPVFDAGRGSVLTSAGTVEGCALIMSGSDLSTGAVACVSNLLNPVSLARRVMTKTPHALLSGAGADAFARSEGVQQLPVEELITEEARRQLALYRKYRTTVTSLFNTESGTVSANGDITGQPQQVAQQDKQLASPQQGHDTVGCVALDADGHVACATSTGGITNQLPGRVGDSPLVGCGGYADDAAGAVSTTGHGESLMKACLAHRVTQSLRHGLSAAAAGREALTYMLTRVGGRGGCVVVSSSGDVATPYTTARMPWAYVRDRALHWGGLVPCQHFTEALSHVSPSLRPSPQPQ
ncbi:isoaspartyl peptidase/L-asparaginase [Hyalella azteca]|uniref:Isoaspartyl peptidase/L-asparaginase n=1 Tax=Hyalella azteca TaxID=294128 RepID=A0A8B7NBE9_HYAAZ|nr:isoaspartyl peptidase/L-asparaginase [Hyalella azteca]XP_047736418.1 isoaspartyl peptidase/L-asparaginase [Hyalella azteca]